MKKWLFNPFIYISDIKALVAGLSIMVTTAVVALSTNTHFDGVLHIGRNVPMPISIYLVEQLVCWLCMVVMIFATAKLFSPSSIRLIDVAGTMALARWPALILVLLGAGMITPAANTTPEQILAGLTAVNIICMIVSVGFVVWMVALFYNAYRVSCNMKGGKAVGIFIAALLLADLLSRIILSQVYSFII